MSFFERMRVKWRHFRNLWLFEPGVPVYNNDANTNDRLDCWNGLFAGLAVAIIFALVIAAMSGNWSFGNPETMPHKTTVSRDADGPNVTADNQGVAKSAPSANSSSNNWTIVGVIAEVIGVVAAVVLALVMIVRSEYHHRKLIENNKQLTESIDKLNKSNEKRIQSDEKLIQSNKELIQSNEKKLNQFNGKLIESIPELDSALSNPGPKTEQGSGTKANSRESVKILDVISRCEDGPSISEPKE